MKKEINIRWRWLKFMYWYTIVGAGGFGLGIIVIPNPMKSGFGWPIHSYQWSAKGYWPHYPIGGHRATAFSGLT